ncbi:MAG: hypothetical protein IJR42_01195 [Paludibacteraceae bacterium]|nr:hypothetical protein [Paludibacteraceae bacterium]
MASERQNIEALLKKGANIANPTLNPQMKEKDKLKKFTDSVSKFMTAAGFPCGLDYRGAFKVIGSNKNYIYTVEDKNGKLAFIYSHSEY